MKHLKLLPVLVLVALLSFVVRLGDMWVEVRTPQQVITASTMAETKPADAPVSDVDVPEGLPEDSRHRCLPMIGRILKQLICNFRKHKEPF